MPLAKNNVRFMKGRFSNDPPKPKHDVMWDTDLFNYINITENNKDFPLKEVTLRSVVLVPLTAQHDV